MPGAGFETVDHVVDFDQVHHAGLLDLRAPRNLGRRLAQELASLLREVDQDGGRVEDAHFLSAWAVGVDDRRHLTVRIDGSE